MRIISGTHKGRRFSPPKNFSARPTTDFAKENIFNVLNAYLDYPELCALDLFSGTGSIAFELCSRGVPKVFAVESNFKHVAFIKKNMQELGFNNLTVIKGDCFKFIAAAEQQFSFIFADPPYALQNLSQLPDLIFENHILQEQGLFVLEHGKTHSFTNHARFVEQRNYGSVFFSLFR